MADLAKSRALFFREPGRHCAPSRYQVAFSISGGTGEGMGSARPAIELYQHVRLIAFGGKNAQCSNAVAIAIYLNGAGVEKYWPTRCVLRDNGNPLVGSHCQYWESGKEKYQRNLLHVGGERSGASRIVP